MNLLSTSICLGIDSFVVCLALGTVRSLAHARRPLAATFGVCDAMATWLGAVIGLATAARFAWLADWAGTLLIFAYGLFVLLLALRESDPGAARHPRIAFLLAPVLSLDNLVYGLHLKPSGAVFLDGAFFGVASGVLALAGLRLGNLLAARQRRYSARFSGAMLIAASLALALSQLLQAN